MIAPTIGPMGVPSPLILGIGVVMSVKGYINNIFIIDIHSLVTWVPPTALNSEPCIYVCVIYSW